jgi:hypothetical protein
LILAYSQCIAHGINMTEGMTHQKTIVQSGLWPLYRFDPRLSHAGEHPFRLDSRKPTIPFADVVPMEARFAMTVRNDPEHAQGLIALAQQDIDDQWRYYEQMAAVERCVSTNGRRCTVVDLTTSYLGFTLANPIVASASPLTGDLDALERLEQAGVAAAVLPSLFEEQITGDELRVHALYEQQAELSAESLSFLPQARNDHSGPGDYLKRLEEAKHRVAIPVIASLNGSSPGGWARYARLLQDAGADAIELNIYFVPTDPRVTSPRSKLATSTSSPLCARQCSSPSP